MTTPHVHAAMITEWVKDTSQIVEVRRKEEDTPWQKTLGDPVWNPHCEYRFKPKPIKMEYSYRIALMRYGNSISAVKIVFAIDEPAFAAAHNFIKWDGPRVTGTVEVEEK